MPVGDWAPLSPIEAEGSALRLVLGTAFVSDSLPDGAGKIIASETVVLPGKIPWLELEEAELEADEDSVSGTIGDEGAIALDEEDDGEGSTTDDEP